MQMTEGAFSTDCNHEYQNDISFVVSLFIDSIFIDDRTVQCTENFTFNDLMPSTTYVLKTRWNHMVPEFEVCPVESATTVFITLSKNGEY